MNLREYYEQLGSFISDHPEALEYKVIYAKDDAGNSFNSVVYKPTLGYYEEREFSAEDEIEVTEVNAVCIN